LKIKHYNQAVDAWIKDVKKRKQGQPYAFSFLFTAQKDNSTEFLSAGPTVVDHSTTDEYTLVDFSNNRKLRPVPGLHEIGVKGDKRQIQAMSDSDRSYYYRYVFLFLFSSLSLFAFIN
jgi:hypothetical protein